MIKNIMALFFCISFSFAIPQAQANLFIKPVKKKSGAELLAEKRAKEAQIKKSMESCEPYEEELSEVKLDRKKVERFRVDYLKPHYTELLGDYARLWNYVFDAWQKVNPLDKKFLPEYQKAYRKLIWYHRRDNELTRTQAIADLNNKHKDKLKAFVETFFDAKPYGVHGWAFSIRKDKKDRLFPVGSVVELLEGDLRVSRYGAVRVEPELGGFVMHIRISNDLFARKNLEVASRQNFYTKNPDFEQILLSARKGSFIDDFDPNYEDNLRKLELLLDPRFEKCK